MLDTIIDRLLERYRCSGLISPNTSSRNVIFNKRKYCFIDNILLLLPIIISFLFLNASRNINVLCKSRMIILYYSRVVPVKVKLSSSKWTFYFWEIRKINFSFLLFLLFLFYIWFLSKVFVNLVNVFTIYNVFFLDTIIFLFFFILVEFIIPYFFKISSLKGVVFCLHWNSLTISFPRIFFSFQRWRSLQCKMQF